MIFLRVFSNHLFSSLSIATILVALSSCGASKRSILMAPAARPSSVPEKMDAGDFGPDDAEDAAPTPQLRKQRKAYQRVTEHLPNKEMSREDFSKLIEDAESEVEGEEVSIEKEPIVSPPPPPAKNPPVSLPTSNPERSPSKPARGGLLTDHTKDRPERPKPVPAPLPVTPPKRSPPPAPPSKNPTPSAPKSAPAPKTETEPTKAKTEQKPKPKPPSPAAPRKSVTAPTPKSPPTTPSVHGADNGIDEDDEAVAATYVGPKTPVDVPRSTPKFQLSEVAAELGAMDQKRYRRLQKDTLTTDFRACNYFLITALVQAKIADERHLPLFMAGVFDTEYFKPRGWKQISVPTLKQWFRDGKSFDVVIQRHAPAGRKHGHVAIPIGLNSQGFILVAEGVYRSTSNRIIVYADESIASKFQVYVRD